MGALWWNPRGLTVGGLIDSLTNQLLAKGEHNEKKIFE